jgi:lipopolysaccharide transport system permease protein
MDGTEAARGAHAAFARVAAARRTHAAQVPPVREVTYTPASTLRHPLRLAREMLGALAASRSLAWQLALRSLRAQYRQSLLGVAWAFLPPIALAAGFTLASRANVIRVGATDVPYPAYVAFGTVLWQTFVEALNGPVAGVAAARSILARVDFPREAIVLAKLVELGANLLVKLVLVVLVLWWYAVPVAPTVVAAPLALLSLVLFGTLVGLLLAPFGLLYRDVGRGLALLTGGWLLVTPVVYPLPADGTFATLVRWNPVTPLLVTTRELATTGLVSDPQRFALVTAASLAGLVVTWVVFRVAMPFVVERVGS